MTKTLECDFCSAPNPTKIIAAASFIVEELPISGSVGKWAACETCYRLIQEDNWEELAVRATETYIAKYHTHEDRDIILGFMRAMYEQLRVARLHVH